MTSYMLTRYTPGSITTFNGEPADGIMKFDSAADRQEYIDEMTARGVDPIAMIKATKAEANREARRLWNTPLAKCCTKATYDERGDDRYLMRDPAA